MAFCANCGKEISGDAAFCPECGAPVGTRVSGPAGPGAAVKARVNTWVAVVLSLIFPGLGQLSIGERRRGTRFLVLGLIFLGTILLEIGIILYPIFVLYNALDVYRSANRMNAANAP